MTTEKRRRIKLLTPSQFDYMDSSQLRYKRQIMNKFYKETGIREGPRKLCAQEGPKMI